MGINIAFIKEEKMIKIPTKMSVYFLGRNCVIGTDKVKNLRTIYSKDRNSKM
jgi:hypothetical protein